MLTSTLKLALLFSSASALSSKITLKAQTDAWQSTSPIRKVVGMLNDMKSQLETEADDDQEVYDKIMCWCKDNREEKSAAITLGEKKQGLLEASITEDAAKMQQLFQQVKAFREQNRANQKALNEAWETRWEESKKSNAEQKELISTIAALKGAIVALKKQNSFEQIDSKNAHAWFVQTDNLLLSLNKVLNNRNFVSVNEDSYSGRGVAELRRFVERVNENYGAFMQIKSETGLVAKQPAGYKSYNNQSGQIYGMMQQMLETMEENLKSTEKEEEDAWAWYKELKAAKQEELAAGQKQKQNAEQEHAKTKEAHAAAEEDLWETKEQLDTDNEFLWSLEKKCAETTTDFEKRTASRNDEMAAITDTIQILDNDDSFDDMNKTGTFLQTSMTTRRVKKMGALSELRTSQKQSMREKLLKALSSTAIQSESKDLMIAYAKLDSFTKVRKAIENQVAALKTQKKDEVDHRDFCVKEFGKNKLAKEENDDELANLLWTGNGIKDDIKTLTTDLAELKKEVSDMKTSATRAASDRGRENADFQKQIAEQRITIGILKKAMERMGSVYVTKYQFLQQPGQNQIALSGSTDGKTPGDAPAKFSTGGGQANAGGGKVVEMLSTIIEDAEKTEKTLEVNEKDAQVAYEGFAQETNKSIDQKEKMITSKTENLGMKKGDYVSTAKMAKHTKGELWLLAEAKQDLHGSCDFIMENFTYRQEALQNEMDALAQATGILGGAK